MGASIVSSWKQNRHFDGDFMSNDILLYAGLILTGLSLYSFMLTVFANDGDSQLQWATGDEPEKSDNGLIEFSRPLVHQFTLQHARRVKSEKYRKKVEYRILTAGFERILNVDEYIGLQVLWGIMLPIVLVILKFALSLGYPVFFPLLMAPVGFMLPGLFASAAKKQRYNSVIVDLPFFIDLLALSTEAGLDFIGAIKKIVEKAEGSTLAEEFDKVMRDISLGATRERALKDLAYRLDINEVSSFVNVLTDADATGASIADVLKEQSVQMRLERFVRAEKAGAKASQAMLIPMMVFILPAVFVMVFAPVALQFFYGN